MKRAIRRAGTYVFIALVTVGVVFLLGPRPRVHLQLNDVVPPPIEELAPFLAQQEAHVPDLIPGVQKQIRFHYDDQRVTEYAVVYVHGFSATCEECMPVPARIAQRLEANLFLTRLTAHGRDGEAFAQVTADWLNDVHEAVAIGKRLGRRVVLLGMSTGATLCLWRANLRADIEALVLLSPNFGVAAKNARFALYPWGRHIVRVFHGDYAGFSPQNDRHAHYWTERYRSEGLVEMLALVDYCGRQDYAQLTTPCLMVYSNRDTVVDLDATRRQFAALESSQPRQLVALPDSPGHGLAGDILAPHTTPALLTIIQEFLDTL